MVGGATSAFISRRLRAAQPRTLRDHGIDPSGIPISRTFTIGRHHSIFRIVSASSTTSQILALAVAVVVPEIFDPIERPQ
jgi:hypothetical protein